MSNVTELDGAMEKLAEYESTGLTPEEIKDGQMLTGWVPVEERMPKVHEEVLVTYEGGEMQVDFIQSCGDWFWENREEGIEVIAWMALPEPYKTRVNKKWKKNLKL
ncbi:MAG TPA: DUF551 domain-containing protein [Candidatus Merdenecus merdavium]|nr:DUF551 domain-containing protein [Candidatus Merdenecus merdavium]